MQKSEAEANSQVLLLRPDLDFRPCRTSSRKVIQLIKFRQMDTYLTAFSHYLVEVNRQDKEGSKEEQSCLCLGKDVGCWSDVEIQRR